MRRSEKIIRRILAMSSKGLILGLGLGLVYGLLAVSEASALVPTDYPNNFPTYEGIRRYIRDYDDTCLSNPNKYAVLTWLSRRGDPSSSGPITVPSGETVVKLQLNKGIFVCRQYVNVTGIDYTSIGLPQDGTITGGLLLQNYTYVSSSSVFPDGSLSPNPTGNELEVGRNANSRYWFGGGSGTIDFDYISAPITSDKTIQVTLNTHTVNHFSNGAYVCAANGAPGVRAPAYNCPAEANVFTLQIKVDPPPPPPGPVAWVQGYKVSNDGGPGPANALITYVCCDSSPTAAGTSTTGNPYSWSLNPGLHRLRAAAVPGYRLLGASVCNFYKTDAPVPSCHGGPNIWNGDPSADQEVVINIPSDNYADLWWHYERIPPTNFDHIVDISSTRDGDTVYPGQTIDYTIATSVSGGTSAPTDLVFTNNGAAYTSGAPSGTASLGRYSPGTGYTPGTAGFTINSNAPETTFTMTVYLTCGSGQSSADGYPEVCFGASTTDTVTFTIVHVRRTPYLTSTGGDVHGGGGTGTVCGGTGRVSGVAGASALDAVVSAVDNITNFSSRISAALANYFPVCRPDLFGLLNRPSGAYYQQHSGDYTPDPGASFSLGARSPNAVVYRNSNATLLASAVPTRQTLVVDGDLYIDGNITRGGGPTYTAASLPALGVVVNGNIFINSTVTNLYGYYFATGSIITCSSGFSPVNIFAGASSCNRTLNVAGSLMANSYVFNRTGDGSAASTTSAGNYLSESVNLIGDLYIAPPPGFADALVTPQSQGEFSPKI